jgi:hypothetical protein
LRARCCVVPLLCSLATRRFGTLAGRVCVCTRRPLRGWAACRPNSPLHPCIASRNTHPNPQIILSPFLNRSKAGSNVAGPGHEAKSSSLHNPYAKMSNCRPPYLEPIPIGGIWAESKAGAADSTCEYFDAPNAAIGPYAAYWDGLLLPLRWHAQRLDSPFHCSNGRRFLSGKRQPLAPSRCPGGITVAAGLPAWAAWAATGAVASAEAKTPGRPPTTLSPCS